MKTLLAICLLTLIAGCAARSSMKVISKDTLTSHGDRVCMMSTAMPQGIRYTVLGVINSNNEAYGSADEVMPMMAAEGRKAGADAVIDVRTGKKTGRMPWGSLRPAGSGTAVKLADKASFNCAAVGGTLR